MASHVSTVTSKFQITLPENVRKDFHVDIGEKIIWEVQGDTLVGKRLPSIMDLAGALKPNKPASNKAIKQSWEKAAMARHKRLHDQK